MIRNATCSSWKHSTSYRHFLHTYQDQPRRRTFNWRQSNISILARRSLQTHSSEELQVPVGKQLKDDFKRRRIEKRLGTNHDVSEKRMAKLEKWDLTVGLEVHAQLNTDRKLFSSSATSVDDPPNTNTTFFDLAFPGSQPNFQVATLIPAIRAAIALNCRIQNESRFDRKHYFYPDQPAGYQLTQYYKPFALDGFVDLFEHDGMESTEERLTVGIKQVQMEQDTGKSTSQSSSTTLVDFNRVGHPLIEIITLPELHSPLAAANCARKIQTILQAVNAVHAGMEMGGLRVDVNVSVSPAGSPILGQRTEIKNLSSFKAVELAIIAERDRQIELLERGRTVAGETRGWTLGDTVTTKLRGKEGEVDYRYMPDPDVLPLFIDSHLIEHLQNTLPSLPDDMISQLVDECGLSHKDARTLVGLDDGQRLDYFDRVCEETSLQYHKGKSLPMEISKMIGNWVIHELGGLLSASAILFSPGVVPAKSLATILVRLHDSQITRTSAKRLLAMVFEGNGKDIDFIIKEESMAVQHLSEDEYRRIAESVIRAHPDKVYQIRHGQTGKLKFFVGQMMRTGHGNIDALKAETALRAEILFSNGDDGNES